MQISPCVVSIQESESLADARRVEGAVAGPRIRQRLRALACYLGAEIGVLARPAVAGAQETARARLSEIDAAQAPLEREAQNLRTLVTARRSHSVRQPRNRISDFHRESGRYGRAADNRRCSLGYGSVGARSELVT